MNHDKRRIKLGIRQNQTFATLRGLYLLTVLEEVLVLKQRESIRSVLKMEGRHPA